MRLIVGGQSGLRRASYRRTISAGKGELIVWREVGPGAAE
jgi:hypothetical protein